MHGGGGVATRKVRLIEDLSVCLSVSLTHAHRISRAGCMSHYYGLHH